MSGRARGFCFTLNNWTIEEHSKLLKKLENNKIEKYIVGEEVGKKNGTPHLQGYIYYKNARSKAAIEKELDLINRIWIVKAKGSPKDNFKYCSKDNKYWMGGDWANIMSEINNEKESENIARIRRQAFIKDMDEKYDRAFSIRNMILSWVNPEYKNMGWESGYEDDDEDEYLDVKQFMG